MKIQSFLFQTLICIIYCSQITSEDAIQLTLKDAPIIGIQVLKVSFLLLESFKF